MLEVVNHNLKYNYITITIHDLCHEKLLAFGYLMNLNNVF